MKNKGCHSATVRVTDDFDLPAMQRKDLWEKFMLLVPISGLTSVTRSTFGAICQDPETRVLIEDCLREVIAVAKAKSRSG